MQPLLGGIWTPSRTEKQDPESAVCAAQGFHPSTLFLQIFQADAVHFTGVALATPVPPQEGTRSPAGSGSVPCAGGCPGFPSPKPPASLLGDFSTAGELCVHGFHFRSVSAKLAGLFVGLFACAAGPSPSEHLPFSNTSTNLASLQIQLLQSPIRGQ